jgi:hypothetical protein
MFKTLLLGTAAVLMSALAVVLMTTTIQLYAPAHQVDLLRASQHGVVTLVLGFGLLGLLALGVRGAVKTGICFLLLAFATLSFGSASAFAQDVASSDGSKLTISYGSIIMQYGLELAGWAITALSTVASAAIAVYVPWAKSVATQKRLQQAGEALAEYAINAVPGSVKDGKVTVNLGSEVVATAVAHGMNVLPAKVIKAAGGGGGLAAIVFRILNLDESANKANTLDPAVAKLQSTGVIK